MKGLKNRSECPIGNALDIFGDPWTLLIVRDMMLNNIDTYSGFLKSGENISTNVLASRLQLLERAGMITRTTDPKVRNRFIYKLTEKGHDLSPILRSITKWSLKYNAGTP